MFVKVCGTTSEDDALLAVAMGADAVGFIFAPSPRQVAPNRVRDIVRRLPPEIITVGVFRDEHPKRVVEIVNGAGLRAAQLHGRETVADTHYVVERVPFTIKAFAAGDPTVTRAAEFGVRAVLLDAPDPGSGQVFDWALAGEVPSGSRVILAGGLDPGNVTAAIRRVQPWGVDACSGLEAEPGRKDPRLVRAFVAAARAAAPVPYEGGPDSPYDWEEDPTA